jgi:hypothetical protein
MSTGRFIVGRDAPAQVGQTVRIPRFIVFLGGQSGRPDLGLCLRLLGPTPTDVFIPGSTRITPPGASQSAGPLLARIIDPCHVGHFTVTVNGQRTSIIPGVATFGRFSDTIHDMTHAER